MALARHARGRVIIMGNGINTIREDMAMNQARIDNGLLVGLTDGYTQGIWGDQLITHACLSQFEGERP